MMVQNFFLDTESYYKTKIWYILMQGYVDCNNKTITSKSYFIYDEKENLVQKTTLKDYNLSFDSIAPGTIGDLMYGFVCTGRF